MTFHHNTLNKKYLASQLNAAKQGHNQFNQSWLKVSRLQVVPALWISGRRSFTNNICQVSRNSKQLSNEIPAAPLHPAVPRSLQLWTCRAPQIAAWNLGKSAGLGLRVMEQCSATINMFHVQTQQVVPSNNCNQHLSICLSKMIFVTSSPFFEKGFCLQILAPLQCLYHRCSSKETPQMLTDILWSGGPWRVALPYSSLPEAEGPKRKQRIIFKTIKAFRAENFSSGSVFYYPWIPAV